MAIQIKMRNTPVLGAKFFNDADVESLQEFLSMTKPSRVLFVDTPPTEKLPDAIKMALASGAEVYLRDHHDLSGEPRGGRDEQIRQDAENVRTLLGGRAVVSNRAAHPGCASLVGLGEFCQEGDVIVADPDRDGLLAAMKAVGVTYPGHELDAALLDGPWADMTPEKGVSALGMLLVKGWGALPPFSPNNPDAGKEGLFNEFILASQGDEIALACLKKRVVDWERAVQTAHDLCDTAEEVVSGVWLVDSVGKPRYDLPTLSAELEARPGCVITIVRKGDGPIAGKHGGVQYSFAVAKPFQKEVNLQDLLPAGFTSSPEAGIISNTTFLLHVRQEVWDLQMLPALRARFAS